MKNNALNDIIREMAGRLDATHIDAANDHRGGVLSETEAYMAVDSLLASLYKQYQDAKAHRLKVLEKHGDDSAMAAIACDQCDSAQCAIDTRLIELREDGVKRLMAKRLIAQSQLDLIEEEREREAAAYSRHMQERYATSGRSRIARAEAEQKKAHDNLFALIVSMWLFRHIMRNATASLSLAGRFSVASDRDLRFASQAA